MDWAPGMTLVSTLFTLSFSLSVIWAAYNTHHLRVRFTSWTHGKIKSLQQSPSGLQSQSKNEKHAPLSETGTKPALKYYKRLFVQLQNIEQHGDVLAEAHRLLPSLLAESLESSPEFSQRSGIFAIERFDKDAMLSHLYERHRDVEDAYEEYLRGRKAGNPRRFLTDQKQASKALAQLSPIKLVDGAWLGYIHHADTPFPLRPVTRGAWRVLSEELGDGDLEKNHARVYLELLRNLGVDLPAPDTWEFIDPKHGLDNAWVFKSAVAQLLISLFPHEFLPEALGFNLHFETISLRTVILAKELEELKIDPKYFVLHITIDNLHCGHAMMSAQSVIQYLDYVERVEGAPAAHQAWKRVQAGYALSAKMGEIPDWPPSPAPKVSLQQPLKNGERDVVAFLQAKAAVSQKLHLACPARIGGKSLSALLHPDSFSTLSAQAQLLHDLSTSRWIVWGNAAKSRLIREACWGGRMFGAFTDEEIHTFSKWINSLSLIPTMSQIYWDFTGRPHPTDGGPPESTTDWQLRIDDTDMLASENLQIVPEIPTLGDDSWSRIASLWFCQICLLESYISVPFRSAKPLGCAITQFLRAQYGFGISSVGIPAFDEMAKPDLVQLGLEMLGRKGVQPLPESLAEILERFPSSFARTMIRLSKCPAANVDMLLGMSLAFVDLQRAVAASETLLSSSSRLVLEELVSREMVGLASCKDLLEEEAKGFSLFMGGYRLARIEIHKALEGR